MKPSPTLTTTLHKLADAKDAHKERHTPTGFGFAVADSIAFLDAAQWQQVTATASVLMSTKYLRALESALPANICQRYALIYRDNTPVAAVVAQVVTVSGETVATSAAALGTPAKSKLAKAVQSASAKLRSKAIGKVRLRLLVCGNLLCWGQHGVAIAPDVSASDVYPAVAEALYRIRRAERLAGQTDLVLVKDFTASGMEESQRLARFSYRPLETDPDMVLEIADNWRTYDDYLASLTPKYRKTVKQIFKDVDAAGCRVERLTDIASEATQLHALYLQVHERAAVRPVTLSPNYLPAVSAAFGDDYRCCAIRRGDELLGFVTTLKDGDTAIGYTIGFQTAANAETPLYFRLLNAVIADAIDLGCKRISFGRTALEPKARLGAKPVPLNLWVRHRVPIANVMLKSLLDTVHHDEAPERNPFKATQPEG